MMENIQVLFGLSIRAASSAFMIIHWESMGFPLEWEINADHSLLLEEQSISLCYIQVKNIPEIAAVTRSRSAERILSFFQPQEYNISERKKEILAFARL